MPENGYTEGVFQSDKNGIEVVVLQTEMRYDWGGVVLVGLRKGLRIHLDPTKRVLHQIIFG